MAQQNEDLKSTLKEAVNALHYQQNQDIRREANTWLQEFQYNIEAWEVCDNLLHDPKSDLETLIFCSQTLKSKVQRYFEELPQESFPSLLQSLKNLLKKFSKGPSKVRTQIGVAIAALAVHVPSERWSSGGVMTWMQNEFGSTQEFLPCFLELLTLIPEEASGYKVAARPARRRQFQNELTRSVEIVLNSLSSCLAIEDLHEQVLDAFSSWLALCNGQDCNKIQATTLASHILVQASLSALNSDKLFDAAVNAISELIRYTVCGSQGTLAEQMPLIEVIVPCVMSLRPRFAASLEAAQGNVDQNMEETRAEDEERVRGIARLFAEIGEAYVEMISNGNAESMMIVEALLEVTSHEDHGIASMSYEFWHELQLMLTNSGHGDELVMHAQKEKKLAIFHPVFQILVSLVSFKATFPENATEWTAENFSEFKSVRYALADVLMDAAIVLGGEQTLKLLANKLFQTAEFPLDNQSWNWRGTESALYCIRAIARAVPTSEAAIMPQVMSLIPKLPSHPQLLETACMAVGSYAKWLAQAPGCSSFLPSIIDVLLEGMVAKNDASIIAPMALRNVCEACKDKLGGSLEQLFNIYQKAISGDNDSKLKANDAFKLTEALSMPIAALPVEQATKALESLCMPLLSLLQQLIVQQSQTSEQISASQYAMPIEQLTKIFRFVKHSESVLYTFQKLWPTFKVLISQQAWDMDTMERLCRAIKLAVKTCGRSFDVMMVDVLEEVRMRFKLHNQPCFLYLTSEVIKAFGSDSSCANYLGSLIVDLVGHTVSLLKTIEGFTSRPDIADDLFLFASRCIRYCPRLVIHSTIFAPLMDCAMTGMTIQHREACQSIFSFFSDILEKASSATKNEFRPAIDNIILVRGADLTRLLIACLVGAVPDHSLIEVTYVLVSLLKVYNNHIMTWLQSVFSLMPATAVTDEERSKLLESLSKAASDIETPELPEYLEDLSIICRRNKVVREEVQAALEPLRISLSTSS